MSDKRETADAIIDEMRDCARAADASIWGGGAIQKLVENTKRQQLAYCDRLEAALERERAQVGNKAALRAALVWVRERMVASVYDGTVDAHEVLDKVEKALAAPPRQCDVGTPEEQERRWKSNCGHGIPRCCKCAVYAEAKKLGLVNHRYLMKSDCKFVWAQMPYEAQEGGAE